MVNKLQGNYANLNALLAQSVNNSNQTSVPTGLQSRAHLAPSSATITDEMLSQFSDQQVDEILNQQLSSLLTISSTPSGSNYKLSSEEVALRTVISSQQEGLLKNERSDQLIERLNSSVKNIQGAYANTSDILSNLGQLGFNQKTFLASSQLRVERSLDPFMENFNRERYEDDDNYGFELSVKTKEGDVIKITFHSAQGYDEETGETTDEFSVSYEVDGDLSEAEHQALTQVLSGVGEMADEFFKAKQSAYSRYVPANQADLDLSFLSNFDNKELSGFDLYFSTSEGNTGDADGALLGTDNELNLSYTLDEDSEQQILEFESVNGQNNIDFSLDMSTIGAQDKSQMQQYIKALDKSLEDSQLNSSEKSTRSAFGHKSDKVMKQGLAVFKSAFSSMSSAAERYSEIESVATKQFTNGRELVANLVDNMITKDPRYQGLGSSNKNSLGDGISKLADFDAKFSFAMDQGDYIATSTTKLSQNTEHQKSAGLTGVTQDKASSTRFNYEKGNRSDIPPDYYDKQENYTIGTAVKNNELVALDQAHEVDVDKKVYQFNPEISQYELKKELKETTTSESNIRVINDIWLEKNEDSYRKNERKRLSGVGATNEFRTTSSYSHTQLVTLIGDLDKLEQNKEAKREYLAVLSQVSDFMDKSK
ncbi:hypothetical protein PSEHALCIP103_02390 [Pseudoalteromonas haloplanktis]|uniref:Uncharacterized protein n=1 Tax=Pseudoalteromonas haloplanktis TaxID=228 RepID=A0A9W4R027_PSEHA|nr:hypothetical protein [Pseudoalteromonas haloplanktis]CAH9060957.1 hypothetical protein PSEHALCIP103_02390 [Pseudoalteromonas haloplanktis]